MSTPIIYYNADLVNQGGRRSRNLPADWDGIFALARKIKALGGKTQGFHFDWDITGNWMWQALVFSNGGTMLTADEKKVAFDGPAGKKAINTLGRMVNEGTMRDVSADRWHCRTSSRATMGMLGSLDLAAGRRHQAGRRQVQAADRPLPDPSPTAACRWAETSP